MGANDRQTAAEAAAPKTGAGSTTAPATQPATTSGVGLVVHSDLVCT